MWTSVAFVPFRDYPSSSAKTSAFRSKPGVCSVRLQHGGSGGQNGELIMLGTQGGNIASSLVEV